MNEYKTKEHDVDMDEIDRLCKTYTTEELEKMSQELLEKAKEELHRKQNMS